MARRGIIGGNWKMHLQLGEAEALARGVRNHLSSRGPDPEVVIFPPAPFLAPVARQLRESRVGLGAQDLHSEDKGAYTGAVSGGMLTSVGCSHVLIGHSERRHVFGDSHDAVAAKLRAALRHDLRPVLCVGEQLEERETGRTEAVIATQLSTALQGLGGNALSTLVIAYEPVWAIGTGKTATPALAQAVHAAIRGWLAERFSAAFAADMRIQYGGSVKPANAAELLAQPDIDGALVGGASLKVDDFIAITRAWRG
jgi:triosephosphate isomerase